MIKGEKIFLRAIEPADVETLYNWENDTAIWRVSNNLTPFSKQLLNEYVLSATNDIYTHKQLRLMICKNDNLPIGVIDLFDFDAMHLRAGIGILIADDAQRGNGYASDALATLIMYCFSTLLLKQVYCNVADDNQASLNLFKKLNFETCATKKMWLRTPAGWCNEFTLQLINPQH
jgi:diamine N-acetyltransferase